MLVYTVRTATISADGSTPSISPSSATEASPSAPADADADMTVRVKYAINDSVYQSDVDEVSTRDGYVTIALDLSTSTDDGEVVHGSAKPCSIRRHIPSRRAWSTKAWLAA